MNNASASFDILARALTDFTLKKYEEAWRLEGREVGAGAGAGIIHDNDNNDKYSNNSHYHYYSNSSANADNNINWFDMN